MRDKDNAFDSFKAWCNHGEKTILTHKATRLSRHESQRTRVRRVDRAFRRFSELQLTRTMKERLLCGRLTYRVDGTNGSLGGAIGSLNAKLGKISRHGCCCCCCCCCLNTRSRLDARSFLVKPDCGTNKMIDRWCCWLWVSVQIPRTLGVLAYTWYWKYVCRIKSKTSTEILRRSKLPTQKREEKDEDEIDYDNENAHVPGQFPNILLDRCHI